MKVSSLLIRNISTCSAKFPPNPEHLYQATHVKHLHFTNLTKYQDASIVQNNIMNAHLQYKVGQKNSRSVYHLHPTILTFEMEPVYTGGKRERDTRKATGIPMNENSITVRGIQYVQTDRGGQVTYHGPGQLVAYFIWDLRLWKNLTSKCFVNFLEQCSKQTIEKTGVPDVCTTENTGVWAGKTGNEKKISSIGLNLKRHVTSHGVSINLNANLEYLNDPNYVMCGLEGFHQTSIANEIGGDVKMDVEDLGDLFTETVCDRMNNYMMNSVNINDFKLTIDKTTYASTSDFDIKILDSRK